MPFGPDPALHRLAAKGLFEAAKLARNLQRGPSALTGLISPKVRPMIERLDYGDGTTASLQRPAYLLQEAQSMVDARRFMLNCVRSPLCRFSVSVSLKNLLKRLEGTHDDMVCNCERFQIFKMSRREGGNKLAYLGAVGFDRCPDAVFRSARRSQ